MKHFGTHSVFCWLAGWHNTCKYIVSFPLTRTGCLKIFMASTVRRRGRPSNRVDIDHSGGSQHSSSKTVVANRGVYISANVHGLNRTDGLTNIVFKKPRVEPTDLNDDLAAWVPVPEGDFYSEAAEGQVEAETSGSKRKQYISTVRGICSAENFIVASSLFVD